MKKRAKPFFSSRIFESYPNQNETSRHTMPDSSGFFFLAQVVPIIRSWNNPMAVLSYNTSDVTSDDLGGLRAGTDSSACRRSSGPF